VSGIIPNPMTAVYFSIASYTTLGACTVTLPDHWRGLGGFEAMAAMLMFGWSTAMLATVVARLHSMESPDN